MRSVTVDDGHCTVPLRVARAAAPSVSTSESKSGVPISVSRGRCEPAARRTISGFICISPVKLLPS